ncbi:MAG: ATP-binding protein [Lactobacillaceae bacterium]|nr:ATP-binding protein [Lactobacillaceae bacterium]
MQEALDFLTLTDRSLSDRLVNAMFSHHLLIVGQTGSGKTTTTLSLLGQLQQLNQTAIIFDPTGEYAKLPNAITYRLGDNCYLEAGKLTVDQLLMALQVRGDQPLRTKLQQAVTDLQIQHNIKNEQGTYRRLNRSLAEHQRDEEGLAAWASDFSVQDLFDQTIEEFVVPFADERANYTLLGQEYDRAEINHHWPVLTAIHDQLASPTFRTLFDTDSHAGTMKSELNFILKMFLHQRSQHRTLVVDLSLLKDHEKSQRLVLSLLLKEVLRLRLRDNTGFPVNVIIDEAHRYLPKDEQELADNGIFQLVREGRKLDLKMILTTQSPLDLPARLRSQFGDLLVHRLLDQEEVVSLPGTGLTQQETAQLPVGQAELCILGEAPVLVKVNIPAWWQGDENE